ncbi:MAG: single-stranded DNA-binding protein [Verrucomicrobia bacterium]|nr:single-stranded DNA-binding protein [Verrucomicrobiota bacterium]
MASFNKVILAGNLTRDPELRYTSTGVAIAKISIAVNRKWRNEAGEQKEEVTFVDVDCFRKQAETIGQYMKKGSPILIEGRLKLDQWEDKQTQQKRSRLGVVMDSFEFLSSGTRAEGSGEAPAPRSRPVAAKPSAPASEDPDMPPQEEDDVPF